MATTQSILRYAAWLEEISPGFVAAAILAETGEDCAGRELLDQIVCLIEVFGVIGAAEIVGCPRAPFCPDGALRIGGGQTERARIS